jgi:hypothetical protein
VYVTEPFQKFHFDYKLDKGRTDLSSTWTGLPALASIAPGAVLVGLPLTLQPDAPFLLTGLAVKCVYTSAVKSCIQLQDLRGLKFRFSGPDGNYLMDQRVPFTSWMANYGQLGNPRRIFPNLLYPPQSTILLDLENASAATTFTNFEIYYRGVKLFPWGQRVYYPYPQTFGTRRWTYEPKAETMQLKDVRVNQAFHSSQDADFVWRATQAGIPNTSDFWDVWVIIKDEQQYPHSNQPVHVDVVFGRGQQPATGILYDNSGICLEAGPSSPGLWYPEIYIPRQHEMFWDIYRDDTRYGGCPTISTFPMAMIGAKVYPQ